MHKGLLGWYGLLRTLFENINWLFFAFTAILLGACIIISNFYDAGPVNKVVHAFDFDQPIVYYHGFLPLKLCLLVLAYTFTCLCVVFAMYVLWGPTKKFSHLMAVLVIGAASKVSMGMSPTVWASSERTIIFLLFGFVIIAVSCAEIIFKKQKY